MQNKNKQDQDDSELYVSSQARSRSNNREKQQIDKTTRNDNYANELRGYQPMTGDPVPELKQYRRESRSRSYKKQRSTSPSDLFGSQTVSKDVSKVENSRPRPQDRISRLHTGLKKERISQRKAREKSHLRREQLKTVHPHELERIKNGIFEHSEQYIIEQFKKKGAKVLNIPVEEIQYKSNYRKSALESSIQRAKSKSSPDTSKILTSAELRHCHRKVNKDKPVSEFDVDYWAQEIGQRNHRVQQKQIENLIYRDKQPVSLSRTRKSSQI